MCLALACVIFATPVLQAQKGGGGGGGGKSGGGGKGDGGSEMKDADDTKPACPGIVGKHLLLEKMTEAFDLTCPQEEKIEPLLHDEESVSKPLLAYEAFTPEEKSAMMLKVKLAARAQIRPLLTPAQQVKSDEEAAAVAAAGDKPKKGGKKGGTPKKVNAAADAFSGEEALSDALLRYSALSRQQKKEMLLDVKTAARREGAPELSPEQAAKIDADIKKLQDAQ